MSISPKALAADLDSGSSPMILDVRSRFEFSAGHIPGAVHLPFWKALLFASKVIPDKSTEVVLYCEHGPRAQLVQGVLGLLGYRQLICLRGHMHRWRNENRQLTK